MNPVKRSQLKAVERPKRTPMLRSPLPFNAGVPFVPVKPVPFEPSEKRVPGKFSRFGIGISEGTYRKRDFSGVQLGRAASQTHCVETSLFESEIGFQDSGERNLLSDIRGLLELSVPDST